MTTSLLNISNLQVRRSNRILKDSISFEVTPGSIVQISGNNGTGKTTMIQQILGLLPSNPGSIAFRNPKTIGISVGYFPQSWEETLLPWLNAWGNVIIGLIHGSSSVPPKEWVALATKFFARDFNVVDDIIDGKHCSTQVLAKTLSKREVSELSGGERQKLILLRTLLCQPNLVFLDEPFRDLDYGSTLALCDYLRSVFCKNGGSVIFVSHQRVKIHSLQQAISLD